MNLVRARWSAAFKPGKSALGHHWELLDADGAQIGRTKLFYEGSEKTVGRLLRATGLSTSGTLHAHVLDPDDEVALQIHSFPGKDRHVEVEQADGTPIGTARRNELAVELFAPGAEEPVVRLTRQSKEDVAVTIEDAGGERIGVLAKQRFERALPSIYDMVFLPDYASNQIAFAATMHLGLFGGNQYHLQIENRPSDPTVATLATLTPLIAAYGY